MDNDQLLVDLYKPFLYLHSGEKYYPTSIEGYITHCQLWYKNTLVKNSIRGVDLDLDRSTERPDLKTYNLRTTFQNERNAARIIAPIYAHLFTHEGKRYLQYIFKYAYNAAYQIFFKNVGAHYADFEHVTIELNAQNSPQRIYFAAHGYNWGAWRDWDSIELHDNRPVVYVARGSHASYWAPGVYWRIFGLANDLCDSGTEWDPNTVVVLNNQPYLEYRGTWGFNKIRGPNRNKWWTVENSKSVKWWQRTFLPWTL
jgi:hypothetical protein